MGKKVRKIGNKPEKNVKTADTIRPLFFVGPHMTLGNYKKLWPTLFDNIVNPQIVWSKRKCWKIEQQLKVEIEDYKKW